MARRRHGDLRSTGGGHEALRIFLLIRSLGAGGAERQLVHLARGLQQRGYSITVGVFYALGPLLPALQASGVRIVNLRKKGRWDVAGFWRRLGVAVREARPDVIYSFLGGANVFGALVRPFCPRARLVWSIRASDLDLAHYDWAHRLAYAVERRLSSAADLIISNSAAGMHFAVSNGFPGSRIDVVPNGIDTFAFRPDASLRRAQRERWGLGSDDIAVGMLARLDPMKGHRDFIEAARQLTARRKDLRFMCIGDGQERDRLKALASKLQLDTAVLFPGPTEDPAMALNGLDVFCSASVWGEGFSNSIGEAMACGVRCVVTDVGDSALIAGDVGIVVRPSDPHALADGILEQLNAPAWVGVAGRKRIVQYFSVGRMVDRTCALLEGVARSNRSIAPGDAAVVQEPGTAP